VRKRVLFQLGSCAKEKRKIDVYIFGKRKGEKGGDIRHRKKGGMEEHFSPYSG